MNCRADARIRRAPSMPERKDSSAQWTVLPGGSMLPPYGFLFQKFLPAQDQGRSTGEGDAHEGCPEADGVTGLGVGLVSGSEDGELRLGIPVLKFGGDPVAAQLLLLQPACLQGDHILFQGVMLLCQLLAVDADGGDAVGVGIEGEGQVFAAVLTPLAAVALEELIVKGLFLLICFRLRRLGGLRGFRGLFGLGGRLRLRGCAGYKD